MEPDAFESLIEHLAIRDKATGETLEDKLMAALPEFTRDQVMTLCAGIVEISEAVAWGMFTSGNLAAIPSLHYQWFLRGVEMGRELERRV